MSDADDVSYARDQLDLRIQGRSCSKNHFAHHTLGELGVDLQAAVQYGLSNLGLDERNCCEGSGDMVEGWARRGQRYPGSQANTLMQTRPMSLQRIIHRSLRPMQRICQRLLLRIQSFPGGSERTTIQNAPARHISWRADTVVELSLAARPCRHF